jgi:hypothetical protein
MGHLIVEFTLFAHRLFARLVPFQKLVIAGHLKTIYIRREPILFQELDFDGDWRNKNSLVPMDCLLDFVMSNVQDAGATPIVSLVFSQILEPRMDIESNLPTKTLSQEPTPSRSQ